MKTVPSFENIEVRRPELAQSYLLLLASQPGRPLALFAQRRIGKTFFLTRDMMPAAREAGLLPVYCDVWLNRNAPLAAITHALEQALMELQPHTPTRLKKIGGKVMGVGGEIEIEPSSRTELPRKLPQRLDALVARLTKVSSKNILLLLDEFQALGRIPGGADDMASLRAVLQMRSSNISAIFTGSSQEDLAAIFNQAGGPMYQFAQLQIFPFLGISYIDRLIAHFAKVHRGKRIDSEELMNAFQWLGYKPLLLKDLVKLMSAEGEPDVSRGLELLKASTLHHTAWNGLMEGLEPLEAVLLRKMAAGGSPLSRAMGEDLSCLQGAEVTITQIRTMLKSLVAKGILFRKVRGYAFADVLFEEFLKGPI